MTITTLTRAEKLDLLQDWFNHYTRSDVLCKQIAALFGSMLESKAYETIWQGFDAHTNAVRMLLGDVPTEPTDPWLHWFCYENNMGSRGHEAGYHGNLKPIKTLEDLLFLIEGGTP
jgi:hypothetical protein